MTQGGSNLVDKVSLVLKTASSLGGLVGFSYKRLHKLGDLTTTIADAGEECNVHESAALQIHQKSTTTILSQIEILSGVFTLLYSRLKPERKPFETNLSL
jgi:hypothetical protein